MDPGRQAREAALRDQRVHLPTRTNDLVSRGRKQDSKRSAKSDRLYRCSSLSIGPASNRARYRCPPATLSGIIRRKGQFRVSGSGPLGRISLLGQRPKVQCARAQFKRCLGSLSGGIGAALDFARSESSRCGRGVTIHSAHPSHAGVVPSRSDWAEVVTGPCVRQIPIRISPSLA